MSPDNMTHLDEREPHDPDETLRAFLNAIAESALLIDTAGMVLAANEAVANRFGTEVPALIGSCIHDHLPPDVRERQRVQMNQVLRTGLPARFEDTRCGQDISNTIYPVFDSRGSVMRLAILGIDVTERRAALTSLQESQRRLTTLMSNLPGMAYRCRNDRDWTMAFVSDGCQNLTGYPAEDLIDNRQISYAGLIHPEDQEPVWDEVQQALLERRPFQLTYRIRTAAGEDKWVWEQGQGVFSPDGTLEALEGFITDISDRKRAEEVRNRHLQELERVIREKETLVRELEDANANLEISRSMLANLASHDPLTGLYNRREMDRCIREELGRTERYGQPVAFIILDIDHFKRVNDTWGHATGDQVLTTLAHLLEKDLRVNDRAVRYGGEEFAVIAPMLTAAAAMELAHRIRNRVAETSFSVTTPDGRICPLSLTVSLGVASAPEYGVTIEALMTAADNALYEAKRLGRNRVECAV